MNPATGLHNGVKMDDYRQIEAVNQSVLKLMERSPMHCRYAVEHPDPASDSQRIGDATHAAILEPGRFAAEFIASPKFDRRTKDGKAAAAEWEAANAGKLPLDPDEFARVEAMGRAVSQCRTAARLLGTPGECEVTACWHDRPTGLACKGRFDRRAVVGGHPTIIEVKTARSAAYGDFARDAAKYGYHIQAAWYVDGHEAATGFPARHVFIVVENEPPHGVAVYVLNDAEMQSGRAKYRRMMDEYAACVKSGVWPGYPDKAQVLVLPHWALEIEG